MLTEVSVLCKASRPGTFVLVQDRTPDIVNVAIRDAGREREEHEVCFSLKDNVSSGPPTVLDVARFVAIQNGERHEISVPLVVPKVGMIDE